MNLHRMIFSKLEITYFIYLDDLQFEVLTLQLFCRYLVICHPMKAHIISTKPRAKIAVIIIWSLAFLFAGYPTYVTVSYSKKHVDND